MPINISDDNEKDKIQYYKKTLRKYLLAVISTIEGMSQYNPLIEDRTTNQLIDDYKEIVRKKKLKPKMLIKIEGEKGFIFTQDGEMVKHEIDNMLNELKNLTEPKKEVKKTKIKLSKIPNIDSNELNLFTEEANKLIKKVSKKRTISKKEFDSFIEQQNNFLLEFVKDYIERQNNFFK